MKDSLPISVDDMNKPCSARGFFCSSFIAACYVAMGILPDAPAYTEYLPCDFAADSNTLLRIVPDKALFGEQLEVKSQRVSVRSDAESHGRDIDREVALEELQVGVYGSPASARSTESGYTASPASIESPVRIATDDEESIPSVSSANLAPLASAACHVSPPADLSPPQITISITEQSYASPSVDLNSRTESVGARSIHTYALSTDSAPSPVSALSAATPAIAPPLDAFVAVARHGLEVSAAASSVMVRGGMEQLDEPAMSPADPSQKKVTVVPPAVSLSVSVAHTPQTTTTSSVTVSAHSTRPSNVPQRLNFSSAAHDRDAGEVKDTQMQSHHLSQQRLSNTIGRAPRRLQNSEDTCASVHSTSLLQGGTSGLSGFGLVVIPETVRRQTAAKDLIPVYVSETMRRRSVAPIAMSMSKSIRVRPLPAKRSIIGATSATVRLPAPHLTSPANPRDYFGGFITAANIQTPHCHRTLR